ncbi:Tctex-1 [Mucor mucedo]|uniref:Dynein light chain n=1 Tax=Mucor saturninus TaxID=64648 RepID=A0A8H7RF53_9FUNG|nr:Tctex-1 [Mucor mucedo]KAG2209493.1 hypothetical protein INT47_008337 [Mucor saturninus]KAI7895484.1 Tctex-1 [Mucor mucedo]
MMDSAPNSPPSKSEEKRFNKDEVTSFIKETVENTLGDAEYSHSKVPALNNTIIETILKKMKDDNKNYKYVVTCVILQRTGAGFYAGSSVIWDKNNDDSAGYRHETKSMYAVVNVFGLSI